MTWLRAGAIVFGCLLLGACGRLFTETTEVRFDDYIEAGMIEQDVFVEKTRGSGEVFRIAGDEAERYADAPVYGAARPILHAPYAPDKVGPYPKGGSLGLSLGDWRAAMGRARHTCERGSARLEAVFQRLVPNGTYTLWHVRFARAHVDCADCPFASIDVPLGAADGAQSRFIADARGNAILDIEFRPCLAAGDDELAAALAVAYHSDGETHGPSPGDLGRQTHVQIFALLPGPDD